MLQSEYQAGPPADGSTPSLRGTVVTADGWPLPGTAVTVIGRTGDQLGRAATDETGRFAVPVSAAGAVTVVLAAPGVDPLARAVSIGPQGATDLGSVVLGSARRASLPAPGLWVIDPAHSIVRAKARHLALSHVEGRFTAFSGQIRVAEPIERSGVEVSIEAASIDTGNADRDAHLRSPDFLEVERFPVLSFRSDRVARLTDERWRVDGGLTIRDITRPVALDVTYLGTGPDPWGGTRIALTATTQLARKDYEINWNMGLPGGLVLVGPTLRIDLEVQAVRSDDGGADPGELPE
jgi:polyisoprenoid-binding protein YceI